MPIVFNPKPESFTVPSIFDTVVSAFSFTFTNVGQTGRTGPSLAQALASYNTSAYSWLTSTSTYNVVNGYQYWTVPKTATYTIDAYGAAGGGNGAPGAGARMQGDFVLTEGEIIRIVVGQKGSTAPVFNDGGGGGGTFVVRSPYNTVGSILVIAGGGGGATGAGGPNGNGSTGTSGLVGVAATGNGAGGTNGSGGTGSNQTTQGGAGFLTNGANDGTIANDNPPPGSFITNALGGHNMWGNNNGGFTVGGDGGFGGGGGANRANASFYGNGGGGGYSGGAAGYGIGYAGGGGSYNSGTNQTNTSGVNTGHGYVIITEKIG